MNRLPVKEILDLSGKVAMVTGANRGLGKAIAEVFAEAGVSVGLLARNEDQLERTIDQLRDHGAQCMALTTDVGEESQVKKAVEDIVNKFGRLDILVNNAGQISPGPLAEIDPPMWNRIIQTNLTGAYLCSRYAAPWMQRQKQGRIINISSVSAQTGGVSGGVHYSASKGGMLAMNKTLARDLAPYNVNVNAIAPGQIETSGARLTSDARREIEQMIPLNRLGKAEDIAYAALFLASPMAEYITGATLDVNGGILKR